jgi:hypothetical protein
MRAASEVRKSAAGCVQRRHGGGIGALEFKSQVKVIGRSASASASAVQLKLQNDQNAAFQDLPRSSKWQWVNTYRIHLPAILGSPGVQGFDPFPSSKKLTKKLTRLFQDSQNFCRCSFFCSGEHRLRPIRMCFHWGGQRSCEGFDDDLKGHGTPWEIDVEIMRISSYIKITIFILQFYLFIIFILILFEYHIYI